MLIPAARAGKLFGGDGGVVLTLYPAFPEDFTPETPLFVRIDGLDVPLWCERFERRGVTGAVAHFADLDTERRASELIGKELFLDRSADEEDDGFDPEDLIGFRADGFESESESQPSDPGSSAHTSPTHAEETDTESLLRTFSGEVTDYYDSLTNPLFEITTDDGIEVLIPVSEAFIAHIDFEDRRIEFVLPEGLSHLNRN